MLLLASEALAGATSLDAGCTYVHMKLLVAMTLGGVQVKYGGILGKFSNLLMIQHGAPGDGKSIALWLACQILYYYDDMRTRQAMDEWKKKMPEWEERKAAAAAEGRDPPAKPEKPSKKDSGSRL